MKKLINDPADVVAEALRGIEAAHPQLRVDHRTGIVLPGGRAGGRARSGWSPAAGRGTSRCTAASSGPGMLDAACAGRGVHLAGAGPDAGGDQGRRRRRRRAAHREELHRRRDELRDGRRAAPRRGVEVETVRHERRRRGRGQPLHRRAARRRRHRAAGEDRRGAAAEEGRDLAAVAEVARKVNGNGRSMGMALTSCTVPAAGRPTFDLPDDEMEIGIGIHGEPGRRRLPLAPAREVAAMLRRAGAGGPRLQPPATACSPSSTAWARPR